MNPTVTIGILATPLLISVPLFILLLIVSGAVTAGGGTLSVGTVNAFGVLLLAIYVVLVVVGVIVNIALMVVTLKAAIGEKVGYLEAFRASWPYFFRVLGLYAIVSLAVIIGLVLLIVPGLIMLRRYFLAGYYVVDRNMGIFPAMDASADESKKARGVWGLIGFAALIALAGAIPHVGWVPAVAAGVLFSCMITLRYIQITERITPPPAFEPVLLPKRERTSNTTAVAASEKPAAAAAPAPAKGAKKAKTAAPKTKKSAARKARSRR